MKKRLLSILLVLSMVLTFLPVSAFAESESASFYDDNFHYYIMTELGMKDQVCISEYLGTDTEISIPEKAENNGKTYPVTAIGMSAFEDRTNLTSVKIPNSVTWIADSAFSGCVNLKKVEIPSSVTRISEFAFYGCESLENVVLPSGLTSISVNAFQECYGLTNITIPGGVQSIGEGALAYCTSLTEITIPSTVTSIGDMAFTYCPALRKVYLSKTVPDMGIYAFGQCETNDGYVKLYYPGSKDDWKQAIENITIEGLQTSQTELSYEKLNSDRPASIHSIPICYNIDVNFNANGGTFSDGNKNHTESVSRTDNLTKEQLPKATKKGYQLAGWCTDPSDAENTSFDPTNIEPSDENSFGGVYDDIPTLYAVWEKVPDQKLTVTNGTFTYKNAANEEVTGKTGVIPVGTEVTVTFDKDAFADSSSKFNYWDIDGLDDPNAYCKKESFTFEMPANAVTLEAMTQDDSIDDAVAEALGTTAMVTTAVAGTAVLAYTGYQLGTEFYLICLLPSGAAIPANTAQLAELVWTDAGKPAPAALLAEDASEDQQAMAWAVEEELISADKAPDASVSRIEVIKTWKKAQSVKAG